MQKEHYDLHDYDAPTVAVDLDQEDTGKGVFSEDDDWDKDVRNDMNRSSDSDEMNIGSEHSPSEEQK